MKFNDDAFMRRLAQKKRELELAKAQFSQANIELAKASMAQKEAELKQARANDAVLKMWDELWGIEKESNSCNQ